MNPVLRVDHGTWNFSKEVVPRRISTNALSVPGRRDEGRSEVRRGLREGLMEGWVERIC